MKIAVSARGRNLDAPIDPRFGRCEYFVIVDADDMNFEAYDNDNTGLAGGAGIQSARSVVSKGAGVVITGNIGPNALRVLSAAGVRLFMGESGTVRQAINDYKTRGLISMKEANISGPYSMAGGASMGSSMRKGMGRGRGMTGRMGASRQARPSQPESTYLSKKKKEEQ